jgi:hypothetical protein
LTPAVADSTIGYGCDPIPPKARYFGSGDRRRRGV